jgi:predicted nucleic acid-binding protein
MMILDTNVLSMLMQLTPDTKVLTWLDRQPRTSIWTTSITAFEVRFGLQVMAAGKKQTALLQALELLMSKMDHRVAAFDEAAEHEAADLMAARQRSGRTGDLRDTMIAGIVIARHATLATRNTAHFSDIPAPVVDPWAA